MLLYRSTNLSSNQIRNAHFQRANSTNCRFTKYPQKNGMLQHADTSHLYRETVEEFISERLLRQANFIGAIMLVDRQNNPYIS